MGLIGLPGDFSIVWATTMITNIYGGMIAFFHLSLSNTYTVAQVTILSTMMLIAHTLPVEVRIAQKAGVSAWFTILLRIGCAFLIGIILSFIFTEFNMLQDVNHLIWQPGITNPALIQWIIDQLRNYAMIFLIILGLMSLIYILKKTGAMQKLINLIEPGLRLLGMSKNAAPVTIIGMTLGLSYGGGLIIKEAKEKMLSKKDVFLSLSLIGLSHSLIEDTLLMVAIGANLIGILGARIIFTIIVMFFLIKFIKHISKKSFERFLAR
jgi:spore maturation protein SpmB